MGATQLLRRNLFADGGQAGWRIVGKVVLHLGEAFGEWHGSLVDVGEMTKVDYSNAHYPFAQITGRLFREVDDGHF